MTDYEPDIVIATEVALYRHEIKQSQYGDIQITASYRRQDNENRGGRVANLVFKIKQSKKLRYKRLHKTSKKANSVLMK